MRLNVTWLGCLMALQVTACASSYATYPPVGSGAPSQAYKLGSGDEIRVSIFGLDAASNTYLVSGTGTVSIPLLGNVEVLGRTTSEVEQNIAGILRTRDIAPRASVSVQVQKYRPFYILGEVQKPGQYDYVPGLDVLKAVSLAGGYTFRADKRHPLITRSFPQPGTARALPTSMLQPGDTVVIPEAWF